MYAVWGINCVFVTSSCLLLTFFLKCYPWKAQWNVSNCDALLANIFSIFVFDECERAITIQFAFRRWKYKAMFEHIWLLLLLANISHKTLKLMSFLTRTLAHICIDRYHAYIAKGHILRELNYRSQAWTLNFKAFRVF